MKKQLLLIIFAFLTINFGFSQTDKAWKTHEGGEISVLKSANRESFPQEFKLMQLDLTVLKSSLNNVSDRTALNRNNVVISIPNADGKLERFQVYEASNFDAELQAQFPQIRSYVGAGIDDEYAVLRMSLDPRGIQKKKKRAGKPAEFMEPYSKDGKIYAVYKKKKKRGKLPFTCSTPEQVLTNDLATPEVTARSSAGSLLTFRLALSCNGEYANHFGATNATNVALVLAQFNATMTRVNGVFEKDFAIHMNIVASTTNVIFYNPATDPYTTMANWNTQLQQTLNTTLTGPSTSLAANNAAYDVGHMFGETGGGGNAGCIGCVCVNGAASGNGSTKGRGITSPADGVPMGDTFDIDYVAHELGHQFGANHTFSNANEGYGVNKEVGGGVTIMGYAGITSYNTHMNSIDIFHSASIAQVQANMVGKTCPTSTPITHSAPVVNAGADYTIPLSTPFVLTGSATDAGGGSLTYAWEQNDDGGANTDAASVASPTKTTGPNFACYPASANSFRYFPTFSSILNGSTTTAGLDVTAEALSSVNRTLNFRLTVRDNVVGQGQTNFDDVVVTVANKTALTVTMAAGTSYPVGSTQTVVWTGATGANGHSTISGGANVDILFSSDNGVTWTTLLVGTTNDGSQAVTLPAGVAAPFCRFMVKASGNVFFNISQPFSVGYSLQTICNTYSNNTVQNIPDGTSPSVSTAGPTLTSVINIPVSQTITDVNVNVNVTHQWIRDLVSRVVHPDGTVVILGNRICNDQDGYNITFNDGSPAISCTAPITSGTFSPNQPLNALNSKNTNGNWSLTINDYFQGDTGTLNSWSVEVCYIQATLDSESFGLDNFTLYPNPNNGSFTIQFNSNSGSEIKVNVHDVRGREIFAKSYNNNGLFNESLELNNVQSGVYLVTVQDGARKEVKKIVVQ